MERLIKEPPEAWVRSIAVSTKARCEGPEDQVSFFQLQIGFRMKSCHKIITLRSTSTNISLGIG